MKYTFEQATPTAETVPPAIKPAAAQMSIETAPAPDTSVLRLMSPPTDV
jgi:hypothetical protein